MTLQVAGLCVCRIFFVELCSRVLWLHHHSHWADLFGLHYLLHRGICRNSFSWDEVMGLWDPRYADNFKKSKSNLIANYLSRLKKYWRTAHLNDDPLKREHYKVSVLSLCKPALAIKNFLKLLNIWHFSKSF